MTEVSRYVTPEMVEKAYDAGVTEDEDSEHLAWKVDMRAALGAVADDIAEAARREERAGAIGRLRDFAVAIERGDLYDDLAHVVKALRGEADRWESCP